MSDEQNEAPEVQATAPAETPAVAEVTPTVTPEVVEAKTEETTEVAPTVTPTVDEPTKKVEEVAEDAPVVEGSSGITEAAKSTEAMAAAEARHEASDEDDEGEEDFFPSFFVEDEDRHRVEVDCLFDKTTKRVTSVSRLNFGLDFTKYEYLHHSVEWFDFSLPGYEQISKWRQRSTVYRRDSGTPVVDGIQLRNFLLVWCLKDFSLRDRKGKKIELNFDENGALSDESVAKVYAIPNAFIDVVLTMFERDVLLSEG